MSKTKLYSFFFAHPPSPHMRIVLLILVAVSLSSCNLIYKLPTRQGNILDQKDIDKLRPGMTRDQVEFVMGTPLAATPFRSDRWDYVGYYKSPRGTVVKRTVTAHFDGDLLAKLEGVEALGGGKEALSKPDVETLTKADDVDRANARRSAEENTSDIILNPENRRP